MNEGELKQLRLRVLIGPPEDRERALDAYVQARITQAIHATMDADTYSANMGRD